VSVERIIHDIPKDKIWEIIDKMVDHFSKAGSDLIDDEERFRSERGEDHGFVIRVMTAWGEELFFWVYKLPSQTDTWNIAFVGKLEPPNLDQLIEEGLLVPKRTRE